MMMMKTVIRYQSKRISYESFVQAAKIPREFFWHQVSNSFQQSLFRRYYNR